MKLVRGIVLGVAAGLLVVACQAAAPPTPTPAPVVPVNLILIADTVQGPANLTAEERASGAVCVQKNRFAKNEEIVWRVRVVDPATGEPMDDQALGSLVVRLPDQELALHYGPHPRDNPVDFFWTVGFEPPESYPSGLLAYTIVATAADGRTGTYSQFGVATAQLTVTEDVRPIIAE
ncbi:MAG: hypothetical protein WD830_07490 [Chloroflexota bacterium]